MPKRKKREISKADNLAAGETVAKQVNTPLKGIRCPFCKGARLFVLNTHSPCPGIRIRYRECAGCKRRLKTAETIVIRPKMLAKI